MRPGSGKTGMRDTHRKKGETEMLDLAIWVIATIGTSLCVYHLNQADWDLERLLFEDEEKEVK